MAKKIIEGEVVGTKKTSKSIAKAGNKDVNQNSAEMLILKAIENNSSVDTMERLLKMRRELKAEFAKEEFDKAMASFQAECPIITKRKKVMNKDKVSVRYSYAPLDDIVQQVKPLLQKNGFSYTIDTNVEDDWVTAICKATNIFGHSEKSNFKIPIDKDAYMNHAQKFASALTFAKRYAFCDTFGIMTGDSDNDAIINTNEVKPKKSTPDDIKSTIRTAIIRTKKTTDIIEIDKKTQSSKKFDDKFKKEIHKLANEKVEKLDN